VIQEGTSDEDSTLGACAAFGLIESGDRREGLEPEREAARLEMARRAAGEIDRRLGAGAIALITGPSGSGKSSILRALSRSPGVCGNSRGSLRGSFGVARRGACVIDTIPGPLPHALATLARAGLADAVLLAREHDRLSEGERFRWMLALAMSRGARRRGGPRGGGAPALLIDEFCSTLDRTTAACVCRAVARWVRASRVRLVAATAHDDVASWLEPELHIVHRLGAEPVFLERQRAEAAA
jgi:ABC-type ATPase with predicted acetyltransferase domain